MEREKQIEFILGGILIVLILGVILTSIYFLPGERTSDAKAKGFSLYERNSEQILRNGIYYKEENVHIISQYGDDYYEKTSKTNFLNIRNKVILENEMHTERTFGNSDVKVNIK